jgi:transcriptional regulator with XRE-family HTH domain
MCKPVEFCVTTETLSNGNRDRVLDADMAKRRPRNYTDDLPNNLRKLRLESGLSLDEIADRVGMNRENIRTRETGKTRLNADEIDKFAAVYGCTVDDILGGNASLTKRERALIAMFKALPPDDQDRLFRIGTSLAQPGVESFDPASRPMPKRAVS